MKPLELKQCPRGACRVKRGKDPSLNSEELHLPMIEFRRKKGKKIEPRSSRLKDDKKNNRVSQNVREKFSKR